MFVDSLKRRILTLLLLFGIGACANAEILTAGVGELPLYAQTQKHQIFVNFLNALSIESGITIETINLPFARSLQLVKRRQIDFHLPMIQAPYASGRQTDYDYSTETLFYVNFVLYDNRQKPVDIKRLHDYIIETDFAHKEYFDFDIHPSSCIECSAKKLNAGRIDGLIYADLAIDPLIRKFELKNIQRRFYKRYHAKIILPKGERGGSMDRFLTEHITTLRNSGKLKAIFSDIDRPYDDWQP